ncbi:MAG: Trk system potassium transporter TrkA [Erysipelotrichaceae bacterium]|jgi:trk system potassium uptake protein TrkA|nr:Trk system potassium transporter TrkA [Erysipelotrichaceae bacterium]
MKIVIVGDGKVGFTLAKQLDKEGHDVTIIEEKQRVLNSTMNLLDVVGIQGNGANYDIQKEANVKEADILIAATSADELNIICCILAKKIGARSTIARIRNPEYIKSLSILKDELRLSMHINPEMAAAREIAGALRFSNEVKHSTFAKSRVEMAEFKVRSGNPLIGKAISDIYVKRTQIRVLFCIIQRNQEVFTPNGSTIIQENDRITLSGSMRDIEKFLSSIGIFSRKIRDVMIVGGGRIAFYLTGSLLDSGMNVKIIEKNRDRCLLLAETFPTACIIEGDGTDHELLCSEALEKQDAFIALTDNDEENIIISLFAANQGVCKVLPKVNHFSLGFLTETLGLDNIITPKNITADQIIQYVRAMQNSVGSNVESLLRIMDERVEILEFRIKENCRFLNRPLSEIKFRKGILIACITHKGKPCVANGQSVIQLHDTVIVFSTILKMGDINDVLA